MRVPVFVVQGEDMGERGAMLKATRIYLEQQNERQMILHHFSPEFFEYEKSCGYPKKKKNRTLEFGCQT